MRKFIMTHIGLSKFLFIVLEVLLACLIFVIAIKSGKKSHSDSTGAICAIIITALIPIGVSGVVTLNDIELRKPIIGDKAANKSGSEDYIQKRYEDSSIIGGTNLDRFFIECVLSDATSFSLPQVKQKGQLLAKKYNLSDSDNAKALFERAAAAHGSVSNQHQSNRLSELMTAERQEYEGKVKYAHLTGRDKRITMLTDSMNELLKKAGVLSSGMTSLAAGTQKKESDWATLGGIASGIAGPAAGLATAVDVQAKNARIRAQNKANLEAAMPLLMQISDLSSDLQHQAKELQDKIALTQEKLVSDESSGTVFDMLKVKVGSVNVSETGAFRIFAKVSAKKPLKMYGSTPAFADGTLEAHLMDGNTEVGTALLVFPVDGVQYGSDECLFGIGLSGAQQGKDYHVTFQPHRLWLMEI